MKARITEVISDAGTEPLVRLETSAGSAVFRVRTRATHLECGRAHSVEFEIDEPIEMGRNAKPATAHRFTLEDGDGRILMTGLVDAIDPDGLVYLRLGPGSLTMVDAPLGQFDVGSWLDLEFDASSVVVYLS